MMSSGLFWGGTAVPNPALSRAGATLSVSREATGPPRSRRL